MKLFTLTGIATSGVSYPPGIVIDWPKENEAERMIAGGIARVPSPGELLVDEERKKARAESAKVAADAADAAAKIVAAANKKRTDAAAKAFEKKRGKAPGPGRPKKAK